MTLAEENMILHQALDKIIDKSRESKDNSIIKSIELIAVKAKTCIAKETLFWKSLFILQLIILLIICGGGLFGIV